MNACFVIVLVCLPVAGCLPPLSCYLGRLDVESTLPLLWPSIRDEERWAVLEYLVRFSLCCRLPQPRLQRARPAAALALPADVEAEQHKHEQHAGDEEEEEEAMVGHVEGTLYAVPTLFQEAPASRRSVWVPKPTDRR